QVDVLVVDPHDAVLAEDADLLLDLATRVLGCALARRGHQKGSSSPAEPSGTSLGTGRPPPPPAPPPPPPPPPSLGPRRSFFSILAVAHRRLGPISSATTSTTDRLSPDSRSSQLRCSSRPVTMMRAPLVRDSLAFSAISRQHTMLKNEVASSHSFVWRFCQRRFTARPNVAVACPVAVNRSSGSRVMLPIRVTLFPLDMSLYAPFASLAPTV